MDQLNEEAMVSTPEQEALIEQAIAHVTAGELDEGRTLLEQVLEQDPMNDQAWVWLSGCVEGEMQRRICLQQALRANPNNQVALDGMQLLDGELVQAPEAPPTLLESRLTAIGMGDEVPATEPASDVAPPPAPEEAVAAAAVAPEPTEAIEPAPTDLVEEPVEETDKKSGRGRIVLLVVALLLLCALVCALVGTQVVPTLLEMLP
jgi:hypothetical protein